MIQIASSANPHIKALRRLQRRRERDRSASFVAEGEDLVAAAERAGRPALAGYRAAGFSLGPDHFAEVEPAALRTASALGSGARVIGVYEQRWEAARGPLCVYLHGVADPGNVGTVLRSAHAFGASCVALGPGCADPHSNKAVRASMGAIFFVALARVSDVGELPGIRVALSPTAERPLRRSELAAAEQVTLLVGAERAGLPQDVTAACERRARIPIAGDSLNAAMAATIALYELTRTPSDATPSSRVRTS